MTASTKYLPSPTVPPPPDVELALPPWTLKATSWILPVKIIPSDSSRPADVHDSENPNNALDILQGLPPGSYPPHETLHASAHALAVDGRSQRQGTKASACILRYSGSPVGAYDELVFLPGGFRNPENGDVASRVTSIYVSSESSRWNGRRNWNMPKHLARFSWQPVTSLQTLLKVYAHDARPSSESAPRPFFAALLTTSHLPRIRIPPALLGTRSRMIQPPLVDLSSSSSSSNVDRSGDDDAPAPWVAVTPRYDGRWGIAYADPVPDANLPAAFGDGVAFPKIVLASRRVMTFKGDIVFSDARVAVAGGENSKSKSKSKSKSRSKQR